MSVFNKEVHQHATYGAVSAEVPDPYNESLYLLMWARIKCETTKVRNPESVQFEIKCVNILQMLQSALV